MSSGFPTPDVEVTLLLVVSDAERSKVFYRDVLGAELYREYGGSSVVLRFQGTWLLLVTGGGPTRDKPDVRFAVPEPRVATHELTLRVPDCEGAYAELTARGATFLTPPVEYEHEIRAFLRDPDGHLIEISQVR
jgi:catechol 2,3-dioxygenase-like lactoylglutathione lyase family enzyme